MQVTILTKAGRIALLKEVKNRSGLGPGNICSAEIEHCSNIEGGYESAIKEFLAEHSMQGTCIVCLDDFSSRLKGGLLPVPMLQKARGTAHAVPAVLDGLMGLFRDLAAYKYGEFCFLLSNLSHADVEKIMQQMRSLDILSLISNKSLELEWLVGLDIESDTGTIASTSQRNIVSLVADKCI